MNETGNRYFNELRGIQLRLSTSLQDPRLSGVNEVISNLYRDEEIGRASCRERV